MPSGHPHATMPARPRTRPEGALATRLLACVLVLSWSSFAGAQTLPGVPLPTPALPQVAPGVERTLDDTLGVPRAALDAVSTRVQARDLLRRNRTLLDRDPTGAPVVRGRVLTLAPSDSARAALRDAGFTELTTSPADALVAVVAWRAPASLDTRAAQALAARVAPDGVADFDHVLLRGGAASGVASAGTDAAKAAAPVAPRRSGASVALVDGGVDAAHPALRGTDVRAWGCDGKRVVDVHGTAVASLLAGDAATGPAPATLYAADIYCGRGDGGAVSDVVRALDWLARQPVAVINISLVGPPNRVLERAIATLQARGRIAVAAVGNDGANAAPLYPAAWPGVIGVTAVDARDRLLPEAVRGAQVDFAAPGKDLFAAAPGARWSRVRGTSFAAPLVARRAALLAADRAVPTVVDGLAAEARAPPPQVAAGRGIVAHDLPRSRAPAP